MRVAVVDIGSNTARLLVASVYRGEVEPLDRAKEFLRLGAEIERRGRLRPRKVAEAADIAEAFAVRAEDHGLDAAEVLVTAPGRQADDPWTLRTALGAATGWPVRVLTHREEGALSFAGATARSEGLPDLVGVVDVGGGSTELAVGSPTRGPSDVHSLDLGSLRLTRRLLPGDPPSSQQIDHARAVVARSLREVAVERPDRMLAVGGTARALETTLGRRLSAAELDDLVDACAGRPVAKTARALGLDARRAETVVGGAILLSEVARLVDRDLVVARGGLREGAVLALAASVQAARRAA
jgi:exopolyphosphatase/guanosine-5'-triphosphate,3'-diphosphate pyrophosphatase